MALEVFEMKSIPKMGLFGLVLLSLMLAWLILLGRAYRLISLIEWLWISFLLVITMTHVRFAPILALSVLPYVTISANGARVIQNKGNWISKILAGLILLATAWLVVIFPSSTQTMEQWANRRVPITIGFPNEAVDFVLKHIQPQHKKILNEFNWGGYIGWRLGDKFKVFVDGRTQVYPTEFWRSTYVDSSDKLLKLLQDVDADVAILPSQGGLLLAPLKKLGWQVCHSDALAIVLLPPNTTLPQCTGY